MDSKDPSKFSLKYSFSGLKNFPKEFIEKIPGASYEIRLERIREEFYKDKPSRLTSVFAFSDLDSAKKFKKSGWTEKDGLISSYKIIKTYSSIFIGDMSLTNVLPNLSREWGEFKNKKAIFIKSSLEDSLDSVCHFYWQEKTSAEIGLHSPENNIHEILIDGIIEIEKGNPIC